AEVQPALRLRLRHFLGDILVRLVYSYASELEPLPAGERVPHPGELERRVRRWADALAVRQPLLRSATMHIRAAEDLYAAYGTERLRAHRGWIIGRALLTATPELASIYLQDAHDAFLRLDDTARACGTLRHVAVCHALLGRRTESIQALGSLDVLATSPETEHPTASPELADLTLLLHDLLPEAEGRRGEDAVLADVLELPSDQRAAG
ncbi:MAG: hypothetical protein AAFY88_19180, partial [Acidobacteriota bacterium]